MFLFNTVSACGGPCNCSSEDGDWISGCACDNCLGFDDDPLDEFREILKPTLIYLGIVITISFLITLGFYLMYRHKKDEHPWKHAIKRSWPWWIIVFLLPFVVLGILSFGFI